MARGAESSPYLARLGLTGLLLLLGCALGSGAQEEEYRLRLPRRLQEQAAYIPEDNPPTPEKIALGKQLFWDTRWSRNGTVACVSCHDPNHGWADARQFSNRFDGKPTPRHSPTLINRLFSDRQQWAGTRDSLEDQAFKASDQSPELLVKHLGAIPAYQEQFRRVFGTNFNAEGVAIAITSGWA
jgi:cytochrome c peroxidase